MRILILLLLPLLFACQKTTCAEGRITDFNTHEPVEGASVRLAGTRNIKGKGETIVAAETLTDVNGKFYLEISARNCELVGLIVKKDGYKRRDATVEICSCETYNWGMY